MKDGMNPFLICALPRSRTAWLANFLTFGEISCFHELTAMSHSFDDFRYRLWETGARYVGNSDSAQALFIESILSVLNDKNIPIVVIERNPTDVRSSMEACGLGEHAAACISYSLFKLAWLKSEFNPLVVNFEQLDSEKVIKQIWNHCCSNQLPFPWSRWEFLRDKQVQVHSGKMFEGFENKIANLEVLTRENTRQWKMLGGEVTTC